MKTTFWQKYGSHLRGLLILLVIVLSFFFLAEIFLPFLLGLLLTYLTKPLIQRIQGVIKNRNLAVTTYIVTFFLSLLCVLVFFGAYLVKDTQRLIAAVETFTEEHREEIDSAEAFVDNLFGQVTENETVQQELAHLQDSSMTDQMSLSKTLDEVTGSWNKGEETNDSPSVNWFLVFIMTFTYYFTMLYSYPYFESKFEKYFGKSAGPNERVQGIWNDFNNTFLLYFRQRTKVVLISMAIFIIAFLVMGIPGAIFIGVLAGLLCYASHFHYLALLPLVISCWVLSVERDHSFFLYFGIVLALFVIVSILDELVFFPKIMKGVANMNPAIMILAFALWIYVFGGVIGTLIALPLTQLMLIYLDRFLIYNRDHPSFLRSNLLKEEE